MPLCVSVVIVFIMAAFVYVSMVTVFMMKAIVKVAIVHDDTNYY